MELLKERIRREGKVLPGNIIKVDGFLNHRVDTKLLEALADEFAKYFDISKITMVLTAEASGIALATICAQKYGVPMLFAKKAKSDNIEGGLYQSEVFSYTYKKKVTLIVSHEWLHADDHVLIIDDFLANGCALLGLLDLNITGMMTVLSDFLPEEVVDLLRMYFTYVTDNPSPQLMVFGLVFSIYFPMRATNSLMAAVRTAYHLGPPKGFITQWIKVLLYTVTLIVTIALTLSLMTFGERALWYTVEHFHLPEFLAKLWVTLRFPVAGAVSFLALFLLYALAQDTIQPLKNICPGVLFSLAAWMAFSWLYSYYVNHFSHYSVLYGSIGAVIVVLIWLNLSAFTLILGAEMNGVLISMRKDRLEQDTNVPKA